MARRVARIARALLSRYCAAGEDGAVETTDAASTVADFGSPVGRHDWYRSTKWDDAIAEAFEARLRRSRDKAQYLLIQATALEDTHPSVSLALLDRYFALGDSFHVSQAHVVRAKALLASGRIEEALAAYEAALQSEVERPFLLTTACLDLPFLIATLSLRDRYSRALELLAAHRDRVVFPRERFQWHAAHALIAADGHNADLAVAHARQAVDAAGAEHSGFRYHPDVGLVGESDLRVVARLQELARGPTA